MTRVLEQPKLWVIGSEDDLSVAAGGAPPARIPPVTPVSTVGQPDAPRTTVRSGPSRMPDLRPAGMRIPRWHINCYLVW